VKIGGSMILPDDVCIDADVVELVDTLA
jgi:hypothetical protein